MIMAKLLCVCVCVGSYDSSVRVWDCRTRTYDPVQVIGEAKDSVTSLQLSGSEILTGWVSRNAIRVVHVVDFSNNVMIGRK